jgi:UDP-N-acetylglucosamine--N-acetylmuramyl-(pentapeptide) pyrophosphoryl-undecaprenol N-acetylglucosamine transferase
MEAKACERAGIEFHGFASEPIGRIVSPKSWPKLLKVYKNAFKVKSLFRDWRPNVVLSTGGYSSGPIYTAAKWSRIPLVLHEQNAVPGRTNRIAAKTAKRICVVFDETAEHFPDKCVATGMPMRKRMLAAASAKDGRDDNFLTLSYGGSQGSAAINEAVLTMAANVGQREHNWLLITGPKQFEAVARALERVLPPPNFHVKAFLQGDEMADAYLRADLAIARAGCGAISELALFGIPAVFIPYPFAQANHQFHNAKAIERIGGASVLEQRDLTPEALVEHWKAWRSDSERRSKAKEALAKWSKPDATERVLSVVKEAANAS